MKPVTLTKREIHMLAVSASCTIFISTNKPFAPMSCLKRVKKSQTEGTMKIRPSYCFDTHEVSLGNVKHVNLFAVSPDERTFYVEAGANNGVRFLLHYEPVRWFTADRLHAECVREVDSHIATTALRRVADACPPTGLVPISKVPGFSNGDTPYHRDGWFSRSAYALPLSPPNWAETAQVFDIREGIYLVFPPDDGQDESYRLMSRKEYYEFNKHPVPNGSFSKTVRQGDCFAQWVYLPPAVPGNGAEPDREEVGRLLTKCWTNGVRAEFLIDGGSVTLDRHVVPEGALVIKHPEHSDKELPERPDSHYFLFVFLLPGSSRPFSNEGASD